MQDKRLGTSFFKPLTGDTIGCLAQFLHLNGPSVRLIFGHPTEEEKDLVAAVALDADGKRDLNRPDLAIYHLIAIWDEESLQIGKEIVSGYQIGFCTRAADGSLAYTIKELGEKSPLLRYVNEDQMHPKFSKLFPYDQSKKIFKGHSKDRLLLKYMDLEIKAAGGLTGDHLRNRTNLADVCEDTRQWMNGYGRNNQGGVSNKQLFKQTIPHALLEDALHHLAYGEIKEARAIFERVPSLLLSYYAAPVTDCSPELTCPNVSALPYTLVRGNWHGWEMILDVIEKSDMLTDEKKTIYKQDLLNQFNDVKQNGVDYELDNLLRKGVRIIDADTLGNNEKEEMRLINEIVERNGYHLIIQTAAKAEGNDEREVVSCTLGYCEPTHKLYASYPIPKENPLFEIAGDLYQRLKTANDGHGHDHTHYFTRNNRDLTLVRTVLEDHLEVDTVFTGKIKHPDEDINMVIKALDHYLNDKIYNRSAAQIRDYLHAHIYSACRSFTAHVWRLWMSDAIPETDNEKSMLGFVQGCVAGPVDKNYFGVGVLPVATFIGNRGGVRWWGPGGGGAWGVDVRGVATFLKSILNVRTQKWGVLKDALSADKCQTSNHFVV